MAPLRSNDRGTPDITYHAKIDADDPVGAVPRARGALQLAAKARDGQSVIAELRQEGSLKALFPRASGTSLQAVFLNTAGGLTGGDAMTIEASARAGARLCLSSQAAERAYRAPPGSCARMDVRLTVDAGARLDWVPQETILFDGAALDRRLSVDLSGNATALIVEPLVFGRVAMGEVVHDLQFTDHWRVRRDGKLVFADAVRLIGDTATLLGRKAIADGAGAVATVLYAGPAAAGLLPDNLPEKAGASLLADDLLLLRLLARDSFELRRNLIPVIEHLSAAPLPRVWRL